MVMPTIEERLERIEQALFGRQQSIALAESVSIRSENAGPIRTEGTLLDTGYKAAVDIRKTTDVTAEAPGPGGSAGAYIQHRASGRASKNVVTNGLRVQMETTQSRSGGVVNDSCAAYLTIANRGVDVGGFGCHVDAMHAGKGLGTTYGVSSELFRESKEGFTAGMHVRSMGKDGAENDVGVLISRGGDISGFNEARIKRAFAAGSDELTGTLQCDVGLDLHAATCDKAAMIVPAGSPIRLSGLDNSADLLFNAQTGFIEFRCYGVAVLAVNMTNGEFLVLGQRVKVS
jgi:hypothetical protein